MKITRFDRTNLQLLKAEMVEALKPLEQKFGIKFNPQSTRFSPENAVFKFEGATIDADGSVASQERKTFELMAPMYGLKPEMMDGEVLYRGELYKITGLSSRASKNNVNVKRIRDNKGFRMSVSMVVSGYLPAQTR